MKRILLFAGVLLVLAAAFLAAEAVGRRAGEGSEAVVRSVPLDRDAFGVAILERDEPLRWEDSEFLKKARLRADLSQAIRVR